MGQFNLTIISRMSTQKKSNVNLFLFLKKSNIFQALRHYYKFNEFQKKYNSGENTKIKQIGIALFEGLA